MAGTFRKVVKGWNKPLKFASIYSLDVLMLATESQSESAIRADRLCVVYDGHRLWFSSDYDSV